MGTTAQATHTYRPVQFSVLPGSTVRGFILAFFYLPLSALLLAVADSVAEGTSLESTVTTIDDTLGLAGVMAIGFIGSIALSLFLAWLGYRSREYEIGADGVTARRGILFTSEEFVSYDELEGVTVTESFLQSLYGAGTVRITDINQAEDEQEVMKMSYIRNPEAVSTNILRGKADVTGASAGDLDTSGIDELAVESESISRFSDEQLAAGTGFRYLMPSAILHPRPAQAAKYGGFIGLLYAAAGGAITLYYNDFFLGLLDLESLLYLLGGLVGGAVVLMVILGGMYYWRYDRIQYELYGDHIKLLRDGKTTTYSLGDVDDIDHDEFRFSSHAGHMELLDDEGDVVVELEYIANSEAVYDALREWVESSGNGNGREPGAGNDREPGAGNDREPGAETGSEADGETDQDFGEQLSGMDQFLQESE